MELDKTSISKLFKNCRLKQIALPPNISEISDIYFYCNTSLTQIVIPSSVTSIGDNAFQFCESLTHITIPFSVTSIGDNAFQFCESLTHIDIPFSVTSIGKFAFSRCISLVQISIPFSVTSIGDGAFDSCISLIQISIPFSVTSIGDGAFDSCSSLEQISIPSSIKSIRDYTFFGCSSLTQITIPSSVISIGDYAFYSCKKLKEIIIPSSVKSVGEYTFAKCYNLEEYCVIDKNEFIGGGGFPIGFCTFLDVLFTLINIFPFFIITIVWWSRIHPWFMHGYKKGKTVYISLKISWIVSLFVFICPLIYLSLFYIIIYLKKIYFTRKNRKILDKCESMNNIISGLIFIVLVLIAIISGIVASYYALKNEQIDGESIKCLRYIFDGINGASDWVAKQSLKKQNEFNKWVLKMNENAYGKDGKATNYYCISVGVPIIVFSTLPLLLMLGLAIMICIYAKYFRIEN